MDRSAIEELVSFTDHGWSVHERALRPLGDELLTRRAPGSGWPALRDCLAHINWAYDVWLSDPARRVSLPVERVNSWVELDAFRRRVRGLARAYLDSRDDGELHRRHEIEVGEATMLYSPAELLVHVLLHERQHHGDVGTLLYQLGLEVPVVEYRFSLPDRPA